MKNSNMTTTRVPMVLLAADLKQRTITVCTPFREDDTPVQILMPSCFKSEWAEELRSYAQKPGTRSFSFEAIVPIEQYMDPISNLSILDIFPLPTRAISLEEIEEELFKRTTLPTIESE